MTKFCVLLLFLFLVFTENLYAGVCDETLEGFRDDSVEITIQGEDFQEGFRWEIINILEGRFGGDLIVSQLKSVDLGDITWSLEGSRNYVVAGLGARLASFFGYSISGDRLSTFPTRAELLGRRQYYNESLPERLKERCHLPFSYYMPVLENIPHEHQALYILERFYKEKKWPLENEGHFFFHDANYHFSFNYMPTRYLNLSLVQVEIFVRFANWLKRNHPELAQMKVWMPTPKGTESGLIIQEMDVINALAWAHLGLVDFGSGNYSVALRYQGLRFGVDTIANGGVSQFVRNNRDLKDALELLTLNFSHPRHLIKELLAQANHSIEVMDAEIVREVLQKYRTFYARHEEIRALAQQNRLLFRPSSLRIWRDASRRIRDLYEGLDAI